MMIIAIHNHKGGVGTTTLAAHLCALARDLGLRVAGASADPKNELPRWLDAAQIPCIELHPGEWPDGAGDLDLVIVDVQSQSAPAIDPDVWVLPITDRMAEENAPALSDRLRGPVLWLPNESRRLSTTALPSYLEGKVEVGPTVPYSHALEEASAQRGIIWALPELARSPGARALQTALHEVLRRSADLAGHALACLTLPPNAASLAAGDLESSTAPAP